MRILLIEDNPRLAELVAKGLCTAGFFVDSFGTVAEAEATLAAVTYHVVVLDLGLPDGDGLDLLARIRRRGLAVPVLLLTARDGVGDRVRGLDAGADDYLLKPFAMDELQARIRALLRRPGASLGAELSCGRLVLDTLSRQVSVEGIPLVTSKRETDLLEQLLRRSGRVVPKRLLEDGLYSFDTDVSSNSLEAMVSRLRKRLASVPSGVTIHTLRGVGYMLAEEENES